MKFSYQRNWFEVVWDVLGRIFRDGWCDFIVFLDAFILVIASFFATPALAKVWSLYQYVLFFLIFQLQFVIIFFNKRKTKVCIYCSKLFPTGYLLTEAIHKVRLEAPEGCRVSLNFEKPFKGPRELMGGTKENK